MEDLLLQFPLSESLLAGVLVSLVTTTIKVVLRKDETYSLPFWIPLLVTLLGTMLFVEDLPSGTWVSIKGFVLQFVVIFSIATLFWKTLGKSVVDQMLEWMKGKILGFTQKH